MFVEVERVSSFYAKEFAVHSRAVAVIGAHNLTIAHSESRFAAVRTVRADGPDVLHLPRPGLIAVGSARQCADGADIDAGATFIAFEMIALIRDDLGRSAAVTDSQGVDAEGFAANTDTAITENTARRVVENDGRPLLLVDMDFRFAETRFTGAISKHHVLKLALAALDAYRAVQWMIRQQELERTFARLLNL